MKQKVNYTTEHEHRMFAEQILKSSPTCQCCGVSANKIHYMVHRDFVKISDVIPVCWDCGNRLDRAISENWISQHPRDLDEIRRKTINILIDKEYPEFSIWISQKHFLSSDEVEMVEKLKGFVIRQISILVKRHVWYDTLGTMKFTGKQILKIRGIIENSKRRRKRLIK